MNKVMKKLSAAACATIMASAFAISASATDYCQAGIEWMIRDFWWEHRNTIGSEALNEMEDDQITCHMEDVNITGNGQYTITLSGWAPFEEDWDAAKVGNLGAACNVDLKEYPDFVMTLDKCTIDGVEYTFNSQPEFEETNGTEHILKIKNPYGNYFADTTPAMNEYDVWHTTEPITFTFTVSGLPEDKIADNPNEIIAYDFVSKEAPVEEEAGEESVDETDDKEESESEAEEESSKEEKKDDTKESKDDSKDDEDEDEGMSTGVIAGIVAAAVAVVAVIAVVIFKKKN